MRLVGNNGTDSDSSAGGFSSWLRGGVREHAGECPGRHAEPQNWAEAPWRSQSMQSELRTGINTAALCPDIAIRLGADHRKQPGVFLGAARLFFLLFVRPEGLLFSLLRFHFTFTFCCSFIYMLRWKRASLSFGCSVSFGRLEESPQWADIKHQGLSWVNLLLTTLTQHLNSGCFLLISQDFDTFLFLYRHSPDSEPLTSALTFNKMKKSNYCLVNLTFYFRGKT